MEGLEESLVELRSTFRSGKTRSGEWRRSQLKAILRLLEEHEESIYNVLHQDLGKPKVEAFRDEVGVMKKSANASLKCLDKWMARRSVYVPLVLFPGKAKLVLEPLGLVLIFSSWNFPIGLSLEPLIGAVAAGNTIVLKPSELAPATSSFLARTLPMYMDTSAVKVFQGGIDVGQQLLLSKWDHIFFTGSAEVGKVVMSAAARHLTPVTLELGGKCPALLDYFSTSARDIVVAVERIANAKWGLAGGQACVGIDYLLVEEKDAQAVIELLKKRISKYYEKDSKITKNITRVVNKQHFHRLKTLLEEAGVGNTIVHGGHTEEDELYIEPTILLNPSLDSQIMTQEIFGPLLPIITVKNVEESIEFISSRPKPLAIYAFTKNKALKDRLLAETSSGSIIFNDAVAQFLVDGLPFGGVGGSGFGRYHGKFSFDTFSHEKAVLERGFLVQINLAYPPWNDHKLTFLKRGFKFDYLGMLLVYLGLKK